MTRFTAIEDLEAIGGSLHLAMGVFDGLHLGHQAVIRAAVRGARMSGGVAGVLTFEPHPIQVLAPEKAPLRIFPSMDQKELLIRSLGAEVLLVLHFDEEMAQQSAAAFSTSLLSVPNLRQVVAGEDWKFGRDRQGTMAFLQAHSEGSLVDVNPVSPVVWGGERISSTRLRMALCEGDLESVRGMLGRLFSVTGTVVAGDQVGRTLGAPTANIALGNEQLPPHGVYTVMVGIDGEEGCREAVANLGIRPTVGGKRRLLEVHLLDFEGNLYGRKLEIFFGKMIRREQKFEGHVELRNQIQADLAEARRRFNAADAGVGAIGRPDESAG